ncbi:SDR family oxidoreductase [Actinomarinicola tropica]|uniref:SDR family oxidoreductase n=1 Tax=Actinomarinicola tropica TaxID=2789776 RepID=A0A5Q2RFG1_9ACTN|nr:SDR family oxidoreductase [Actinomarinicola tropica]QGG94433.1 SDR family oxidoreductase [Actinomarinicola tropica]
MTDYPQGNRLDGKVALISGGARGLGEAFARAMVAQGAKVVIGDMLDDDGKVLADELGEACTYVHLDVTDRTQWDAAVAAATRTYGRLNVLVNNAGIVRFGPIDEFPVEQWDEVLDVNLNGVFHGIQASVAALKDAAPSSIINISSTAGLQGYVALSAYNATKFAVRGLTKSVALDLGTAGVRCNSVHPGAVLTPMTEDLDLPQRHVAMRRVGQPPELAHLVVYLASDESTFCTGAEFTADGGETAGLAAGATATT